MTAHFVASGWSLKWLHAEILNSATWQQSSLAPASEAFDPENTAYARMNRRRLDFEAWRDSVLQVSGGLDAAMGGPPLELGAESNLRRTVYGKIHRRDLDVMLRLHDFPDPTAHSPKRAETNTPLQALFALNGDFIQRQAEALAESLAAGSLEERITAAYHLVFQRDPLAREMQLGKNFLRADGHPDNRDKLWINYAQVLLSSNEFLFLD